MLGVCSLIIGTAQWLCFMSNFVRGIPNQDRNMEESYILMPVFLAPLGLLFAYTHYRTDEVSRWGVIMNTVMVLLPFLYVMVGKLATFL
jgi:hypothetical protein